MCARISLEKKEADKIKEYCVNRNSEAVDHMLVPCAVDLMGRWGPRMKSFFEAIVRRKKNVCPQLQKEVAKTFRFIKERIGISAIKAIGAYMTIVRHGWTRTRHGEEAGDDREENAVQGEVEASNTITDISYL